MIPNIAQSIDDIIKNATPEQKVIWQQVRLLVGENAAIQQYFYIGPTAGSELTVYAANKLYLANVIEGSGGVVTTSVPLIQLLDRANVVHFVLSNFGIMYDSTAAVNRYGGNVISQNNVWFSRINVIQVANIKFNGYKIIY
jgi:hypothetical protein